MKKKSGAFYWVIGILTLFVIAFIALAKKVVPSVSGSSGGSSGIPGVIDNPNDYGQPYAVQPTGWPYTSRPAVSDPVIRTSDTYPPIDGGVFMRPH